MAGKHENSVVKVLIVDSHPLYREGLVRLIANHPHWVLCGQADNEKRAGEIANSEKPDLIILSLNVQDHGGLDLVRTLKTCSARSRILVTSDVDDPHYVERALRAGTDGYLLKIEDSSEIQLAMNSVATGELYISPTLVSKMLKRSLRPASQGASGVESLSDRELRVLELLGEGLPVREIAARLHLSRKTVDSHRENIKRKLGMTAASALTRFACDWLQRRSPDNFDQQPRL